jgi:hypothetical protein
LIINISPFRDLNRLVFPARGGPSTKISKRRFFILPPSRATSHAFGASGLWGANPSKIISNFLNMHGSSLLGRSIFIRHQSVIIRHWSVIIMHRSVIIRHCIIWVWPGNQFSRHFFFLANEMWYILKSSYDFALVWQAAGIVAIFNKGISYFKEYYFNSIQRIIFRSMLFFCSTKLLHLTLYQCSTRLFSYSTHFSRSTHLFSPQCKCF